MPQGDIPGSVWDWPEVRDFVAVLWSSMLGSASVSLRRRDFQTNTFCEYFASSAGFCMRTARMPGRWVSVLIRMIHA